MQSSSLTRFLAACLVTVSTATLPTTRPALAQPAADGGVTRAGGVIQAINVTGNQRIEGGTIRSYMLVRPGDPFDADRIDRSLKTLFSTGLFQDVQLTREGGTLTIRVVENPLVNRIAFEGNKKIGDDQLRPEMQTRPRAVFTPSLAEADRRKILELYARKGNYDAVVEPKIIRLDQNRVDVVFQIADGATSLISKIAVVGNRAFSEDRLTEVISARESRWWRVLSNSDQYDPERLSYDKELLRRFYLKNGYADIEILDATAELSPDRKGFFLTYTIREGQRYRVGPIVATSQIRGLTAEQVRSAITLREGDWYDGDAVGRSAEAIEEYVHNRGYAFVEVKPRVKKDADRHIIELTFEVGEGPRVFIERIDITGNTRTKDRVIRREFRLAEGDAFNAELLRRSRTRLTDLGYFNGVDITTSPGTAPDRAVVTARVAEKATGELSFGGGYSTDAGALVNVGLAERNLVGTGVNAAINGTLAQRRSSLNASVTDPYFLDRNLVAGIDAFLIQTQNLGTQVYDERRIGGALRLGYDFNEHLRQVWSYSAVSRKVFNVVSTASPLILNQAGTTFLSQVSQLLTLDYRDSRIFPRSGGILELGTDYAGLGGDVSFARGTLSGAYYIPLDRLTGDDQWVFKVGATVGYMEELGHGKDLIIDRFFLGGDNLRGFQTGGAGPHDTKSGDPLGGRFIWTQTSELRFPLPGVPQDVGLAGRAFVDIGALTQASFRNGLTCTGCNAVVITQSGAPRIGAGVGISWRTQFGLINIDIAPFVSKQKYDQTQLIRFGFGTKF